MYDDMVQNLEGSSICISGGNGFIGSRFIRLTDSNLVNFTKVHSSELNRNFRLPLRTDFIVHLAGQKNLRLASMQPIETLEAEFRMAVSLLEAARLTEHPPKKILLVSSASVYDGEGEVFETTSDAVGSIYAASKKNVENLGKAYAAEYGLPVVIARLSNVYGPGQSNEALIPSIIDQMRKNTTKNGKIVLGNIKSVRDFVFIDDVVEGLVHLLLSSASSGEVFNLSTGVGHSVEDIVSVLASLFQYQGSINSEHEKIRFKERQVLIVCNQRLRALTGWSNKYSLKDGLALTLKDYVEKPPKGLSHAM